MTLFTIIASLYLQIIMMNILIALSLTLMKKLKKENSNLIIMNKLD